MTEHDAESSLAALLCALSFATGLALGDRMEHGIDSAYLGLRLADALGLGQGDREAVYYGGLLKDAGCTACTSLFVALFPDEASGHLSESRLVDRTKLAQVIGWLWKGAAPDASLPVRAARLLSLVAQCSPVFKEAATSHCEIAEMFCRRLGFAEHVQVTLRFQSERWDGKGPAYGLKGNDVPVAARVLSLAQVAELSHGFGGRQAARVRIQEGRGRRFDPDVAGAFLVLSERDEFWGVLEQDSPQAVILAMRPSTAAELRGEAQIDTVCEALADFTDIKMRRRWQHSTEVAAHAVTIARRLGQSQAAQNRVRRAALVHDLGMVAVPFSVLSKEEEGLTEGERESLRLHTYYTERVLERSGPLRALAAEAAAHHEWLDGEGYHRRLKGDQIPLNGRILAVADAYSRLARQHAGPTDGKSMLARLRSLAGAQLDPACCAALAESLRDGPVVETSARPRASERLTEREIEVLRLLAQGLSNPQIGRSLVISTKTVEHHLAHIYDKLAISTRTSAVAYAVHHGIA